MKEVPILLTWFLFFDKKIQKKRSMKQIQRKFGKRILQYNKKKYKNTLTEGVKISKKYIITQCWFGNISVVVWPHRWEHLIGDLALRDYNIAGVNCAKEEDNSEITVFKGVNQIYNYFWSKKSKKYSIIRRENADCWPFFLAYYPVHFWLFKTIISVLVLRRVIIE